MTTRISDARIRQITRKCADIMKTCQRAHAAFDKAAVANAKAKAKLQEFDLLLERSGLKGQPVPKTQPEGAKANE